MHVRLQPRHALFFGRPRSSSGSLATGRPRMKFATVHGGGKRWRVSVIASRWARPGAPEQPRGARLRRGHDPLAAYRSRPVS